MQEMLGRSSMLRRVSSTAGTKMSVGRSTFSQAGRGFTEGRSEIPIAVFSLVSLSDSGPGELEAEVIPGFCHGKGPSFSLQQNKKHCRNTVQVQGDGFNCTC